MSEAGDRPTTPIVEEEETKKQQEATTLIVKKESKKKKTTVIKAKKTKKTKYSKYDKISRLERYEELDRNHPLNQPYQGDPNFRGPIFHRKKTNWVWNIVFLIFNLAFITYAVFAWKDGAAQRLVHGMDFRAEICGVGKLESRPYLYFISPTVDINVKMCVESCPETAGKQICLYDVDPTELTGFCYREQETISFGKTCLPNEPINRSEVDTELSSLTNLIKSIAGDLSRSFDTMAFGLVIAILMAFAFYRTMRVPNLIKYVIWISIWGTLFALGCTAYFFYQEYRNTIELRCIQDLDRHDCGGQRAEIFFWFFIAFIALGVLYFGMVMKLFNKINLGIGILKSVSECAVVMHQVRNLPWVLTGIALVVGTIFIYSIVQGFSVGSIFRIPAENIDGGEVFTIEYDELFRTLSVFQMVMFLWWLDVILLVGDSIISYCLAIWFFERQKRTVVLPVNTVSKIIMRYHLGTLIQLACYKIVFKIPKAIFSNAKKILTPKNNTNPIIKLFQECCVCCLHCQERFLRYISKNLIPQMCIWSTPFSPSAKRGYFLIYRHSRKFKNMDFLVSFILFQTKLFCALFGGVFVNFFIQNVETSAAQADLRDVETPILPTMVIFYFGFFYASVFQNVFDIAARTILECYLMDEEMFVGEQRYVEKHITVVMEYYKKAIGYEDDKYAKEQNYVTGIGVTKHVNLKFHEEADPDAEANKKYEREVASESSSEEEKQEQESSSSSSSGSGSYDSSSGSDSDRSNIKLQQPTKGPNTNKTTTTKIIQNNVIIKKKNSSDEDDDDDSEESETQVGTPRTQTMFQNQKAKKPQKKVEDSDDEDDSDEEADQVAGWANPTSLGNNNKSKIGTTIMNPSGFGNHINLNKPGPAQPQTKVINKTIVTKKKREESDDDDDEDDSDEDDDDDDEDDIAGWANPTSMANKKGGAGNKPKSVLEDSKLKSQSHFQGDQPSVDVKIDESVRSQAKLLDKSGAKSIKGDAPSVFNQSKLANNSTMKLEYDDDGENQMKYRL